MNESRKTAIHLLAVLASNVKTFESTEANLSDFEYRLSQLIEFLPEPHHSDAIQLGYEISGLQSQTRDNRESTEEEIASALDVLDAEVLEEKREEQELEQVQLQERKEFSSNLDYFSAELSKVQERLKEISDLIPFRSRKMKAHFKKVSKWPGGSATVEESDDALFELYNIPDEIEKIIDQIDESSAKNLDFSNLKPARIIEE